MIRRKKKPMVYSKEFREELNRRYDSIKNGTAVMVSAEESDRRINEILSGIRAKQNTEPTKSRSIWPFSKPRF